MSGHPHFIIAASLGTSMQPTAIAVLDGQRGHFYEAWESDEDWERIQVPATECPRITAEFLAAELAALGKTWFNQEYKGYFVETIDAVFRMDDIKRSITDEVTPLFETPPDYNDVKPLVLA